MFSIWIVERIGRGLKVVALHPQLYLMIQMMHLHEMLCLPMSYCVGKSYSNIWQIQTLIILAKKDVSKLSQYNLLLSRQYIYRNVDTNPLQVGFLQYTPKPILFLFILAPYFTQNWLFSIIQLIAIRQQITTHSPILQYIILNIANSRLLIQLLSKKRYNTSYKSSFNFILIIKIYMEPTVKPQNSLLAKRAMTQASLNANIDWNVGSEYKVNELIGKGAYSVVAAGTHIKSGKKVAIKRIIDPLAKQAEALRILRQVVLLKNLSHPNIIKLYQIIIPDTEKLKEIFLIEEYFPKDIKKLMKSNQHLTQREVQVITYSILAALKYLNSAKVLHRDLKPENILVNSNNQVKLCDFGLARPVAEHEKDAESSESRRGIMDIENQQKDKDKSNLTGHVVTRWYRAPQVILLERNYNSKIDVWSAGCIFAELLNMIKENAASFVQRSPIFPGKACYPLSPPKQGEKLYKPINQFPHSSDDQLNKIFQIIGTPTDPSDYDFITDERAIKYIKSFSPQKKRKFRDVFKQLTLQSEDFLDRTLVFNPNSRMTIQQAVEHPLFDQVRDTKLQIQTKPLILYLDDLTKQQIKEQFLTELNYFKLNPPKF